MVLTFIARALEDALRWLLFGILRLLLSRGSNDGTSKRSIRRVRCWKASSIPLPTTQRFMHHAAWSDALFMHYAVSPTELKRQQPPQGHPPYGRKV